MSNNSQNGENLSSVFAKQVSPHL